MKKYYNVDFFAIFMNLFDKLKVVLIRAKRKDESECRLKGMNKQSVRV